MKAKHIVLVIVSLFICLGLFAQAVDQAAAASGLPGDEGGYGAQRLSSCPRTHGLCDWFGSPRNLSGAAQSFSRLPQDSHAAADGIPQCSNSHRDSGASPLCE